MPIPGSSPASVKPSNEVLAAVGQVAVASAALEARVYDAYAAFTGAKFGTELASLLGFNGAVRHCLKVVQLSDASDSTKARVTGPFEGAKSLWIKRSLVVHGEWTVTNEGWALVTAKRDGWDSSVAGLLDLVARLDVNIGAVRDAASLWTERRA